MFKRKSYFFAISLLILLTVGTLVMFIEKESPSYVSKSTDEKTSIKSSDLASSNKNLTSKELIAENDETTESTESQEVKNNSENKDPEKDSVAKNENETTTVTATKYVSVSSLNVRSGPGTDNPVVGMLKLNQVVKAVIQNDQEDWMKITAGEISGYVNGKYLSNKIVPEQEQEPSKDSSDTKDANNQNKSNKTNVTTSKSTNNTETKEKEESKAPVKTEQTSPENDAEKLKNVDQNNQLILVTTNGYGTSSAKVQTFERNADGNWTQVLSTSGHIGKNGFAKKKVEGDGKSPRGKYSIGTAFGRTGNPGTKLPFRSITSDDVWVDDSNSNLYNSWQSRKKTEGQWSSAENMDIPQYNYGFVINYNTNRVPGAGSAIFFHVSSGYTLGCTGVSQGSMVSILKWLDPGKNPVIIQTPISELSNY